MGGALPFKKTGITLFKKKQNIEKNFIHVYIYNLRKHKNIMD